MSEPKVQPSERIRACYDAVAAEYAKRFGDELSHKPLDRELLSRFALAVSDRGEAIDVGCGPGQTTAYLHGLGVLIRGVDLSPELIREARNRHPGVPFETGDMLALSAADKSLAGVVAFYAIVHLSHDELCRFFTEVHRMLQPGGRLLLAFHVGDGAMHVEKFLGRRVSLDFEFFQPGTVADELTRARFVDVDVIEREPYPQVEYPSRRAYVFARKRE